MMAFLDFLGQGVGGMQQAQGPNLPAQGPNMTGNAGVDIGAGVGPRTPVGPTWGDIAQAALAYGSKPGSSGPTLAGQIPSRYLSNGQITPLQPTELMQTPQEKKPQEDSFGKILSWFTALLGV